MWYRSGKYSYQLAILSMIKEIRSTTLLHCTHSRDTSHEKTVCHQNLQQLQISIPYSTADIARGNHFISPLLSRQDVYLSVPTMHCEKLQHLSQSNSIYIFCTEYLCWEFEKTAQIWVVRENWSMFLKILLCCVHWGIVLTIHVGLDSLQTHKNETEEMHCGKT